MFTMVSSSKLSIYLPVNSFQLLLHYNKNSTGSKTEPCVVPNFTFRFVFPNIPIWIIFIIRFLVNFLKPNRLSFYSCQSSKKLFMINRIQCFWQVSNEAKFNIRWQSVVVKKTNLLNWGKSQSNKRKKIN